MRQIGTMSDEAAARTLADYLLTLGITTRLDQTDNGWVIWVHQEDKLPVARTELDAFVKAPTAPKYRGHAAAARELRRQAERAQREHLKNTLDVRYIWAARDWRRCPVTWLFLALCLGFTFWTKFGTNDEIMNRFFVASYEVLPLSELPRDHSGSVAIDSERGTWIKTNLLDDLKRGQFWRLITPIFLHMNPLHLAFNLTILYQLGTAIEIRRGHLNLALLILFSAVASNLGQYFEANDPRFGGISGVDLALFGYCWMKGMYEPELGLGLTPGTILFVILFLAVTMLGQVGFIAHGAHVVGLAAGILVGVAPHLLNFRVEPSD